jgi:hypothetical protein
MCIEDCMICLDKMTMNPETDPIIFYDECILSYTGNYVFLHCCKKSMHMNCLTAWNKKHSTCPHCRAEINILKYAFYYSDHSEYADFYCEDETDDEEFQNNMEDWGNMEDDDESDDDEDIILHNGEYVLE